MFDRFWSTTSDARRRNPIMAKLEDIHLDIRRLFHVISQGDRKIMSDLDTLNAAVAAVQVDENAEDAALTQLEGVGTSLQASLQILEAEAAAGAPNLQPTIAAVNALKTQNDARLAKLQADLAAGTTLEGTLPQPAAAAPSTPTSSTPPASGAGTSASS